MPFPLTPKGKKAGASGDYPMPDAKHARLAKSGAAHAANVGNITRGTKARIDAKADKMLDNRSGSKTDGGKRHD